MLTRCGSAPLSRPPRADTSSGCVKGGGAERVVGQTGATSSSSERGGGRGRGLWYRQRLRCGHKCMQARLPSRFVMSGLGSTLLLSPWFEEQQGEHKAHAVATSMTEQLKNVHTPRSASGGRSRNHTALPLLSVLPSQSLRTLGKAAKNHTWVTQLHHHSIVTSHPARISFCPPPAPRSNCTWL